VRGDASRMRVNRRFWQIVLALVVWPYYVGNAVARG
jgi:hypothetical protein